MNYKKKKKKKTYLTKKVKRIKINLDFIFNNFSVHRTGLRLVLNVFLELVWKILFLHKDFGEVYMIIMFIKVHNLLNYLNKSGDY